MLVINGEEKETQGRSLREWLLEEGYPAERIAVECNGAIVPRAEYEKRILQDGDVLEIVRFVGGG